MRTSIEISDALLSQARRLMAKKGLTLRALVEDGLRQVLEGERRARPFKLRDASFHGIKGFAAGATSDDLRAAIDEHNEGR